MMHPDTELRFISEAIGHGVVATRDIPAGTITWVQDKLDREFTPEQVLALGGLHTATLEKYCFRNQHGRWVLCWDHARFVNHSFRSNSLTTGYGFEVAIRDIRAGEEVTDDYGYLNIMRPFEAIDEGVGRTTVYPDDLTRHHAKWDRQLQEIWAHIPEVRQALKPLLAPEVWTRICRVARGAEEMVSILELYYHDETNPPAAGPRPVDRRTIAAHSRSRNGQHIGTKR
ncbi:MAG: SET domain-containing protein [Phycisphaerales bacterium]